MIKAISRFLRQPDTTPPTPAPPKPPVQEPSDPISRMALRAIQQIDADDAEFQSRMKAMNEQARKTYQETMDIPWAVEELIISVKHSREGVEKARFSRPSEEVAIEKASKLPSIIHHIKSRRDSYQRGAILTKKEGQPCFEQIVADELTTILNMFTPCK